jgi:aspartate/methionine/tyrosine aminotransferase
MPIGYANSGHSTGESESTPHQCRFKFWTYACESLIALSTSPDHDVPAQLPKDEGVAVVHGSAFGLSGHFRLSFAASTEMLEKSCDRIRPFCSALA